MADYINRACLMGKLTSGDMQMRLREMDGGEAYNVFLTLVNSEPDAVVCCKECKHYHEAQGWCDKHSHFDQGDWEMFYEDDFCSCGERRSGGNATESV